MNIPDIEGLLLGRALAVLVQSGIEVADIEVTGPPYEAKKPYHDGCRVLRAERDDEGKLRLLVCSP